MAMTTARNLEQLIDAVKRANDWSDEDIAERARRAGHQASKQNIARARTERPLRRISSDFMRALADGLGVALVDVVRAALVSAELPDAVGEGVSAEWAIQHDPTVPAHLRRVMLTLLADAQTAATSDGRSDFALAAQEEPGASGDGELRRGHSTRRHAGNKGPKPPQFWSLDIA